MSSLPKRILTSWSVQPRKTFLVNFDNVSLQLYIKKERDCFRILKTTQYKEKKPQWVIDGKDCHYEHKEKQDDRQD